MEYPIKSADDLPVFEYVLDWVRDTADAPDYLADAAKTIGESGVVATWINIPLELHGWLERSETMMLGLENPELMDRLVGKMWAGQIKLAESALMKGSDVIMFGIPGTELTSPPLYRKYALPYAKQIVALAKKHGKCSYLHSCGKVQSLLNEIKDMHPSIFETFAPPPEGDTSDIAATRDFIGRDIVAKGNMNLTFFTNSTADEVYKKGQEIISQAGDRFILSVADVLLGSHKEENVAALVRAGHERRLQ
jgi:uroporphyrinogen-III decarboxylase